MEVGYMCLYQRMTYVVAKKNENMSDKLIIIELG